jgi:predicted nucleic acid-binding protein
MLADHRVRMHPHVLGELCMGNLPRRSETVEFLTSLRSVPTVADDEVMQMIETGRLFGTGLSWVDAHLLASTLVIGDLRLWTRDRRLSEAAGRFGKSASLHH